MSRLACAGLACLGVAVTISAASAGATSAGYSIEGGTARQQAQVRLALNASTFDWSIVPQVTIRILRGAPSSAGPGLITLDADLLDAGRLAWGVIQHEYAHEVDMLVLDDGDRARLASALGGDSWWPTGLLSHGALTSERFASTLAWAYWPSQDNIMRPESAEDEAGAIAPAAFRTLLAKLLQRHQLSGDLAAYSL